MATLTASGKKVGRPARTYSPEQTTKALLTVIACAGNLSQARKRLLSEGEDVPLKTLSAWKDSPRYRELERTHGRAIEDELVDHARRSAMLAAELEREGLQAALEDVRAARTAVADLEAERITPNAYRAIMARAENPAQMALNASKIKGGNVDQVLKLTGRPTEITEHRNVDDFFDALYKKLGLNPAQPVDATVVDDDPKELPA